MYRVGAGNMIQYMGIMGPEQQQFLKACKHFFIICVLLNWISMMVLDMHMALNFITYKSYRFHSETSHELEQTCT